MSKDKLPALQFYTGDWRKDPGVQALDHELKGIWIDLLCIMHESEERGRLVLPNGQPFPDVGIARNLSLDVAKWKQKRQELLDYGVASEDENGVLYNRRMVRDERLRHVRAKAGAKGGKAKRTPSPAASKREAKRGSSVSVSSSASPSGKEETANAVLSDSRPTSEGEQADFMQIQEEPKADPPTWMHRAWERQFGNNGRPLKLTDERRQKYRAMYTEQLKDTPDAETAWRAVLHAVSLSSHHTSNRAYLMPESLLLNASRRDKWVQQTMDTLARGPPGPDRDRAKQVRELADYLKQRESKR